MLVELLVQVGTGFVSFLLSLIPDFSIPGFDPEPVFELMLALDAGLPVSEALTVAAAVGVVMSAVFVFGVVTRLRELLPFI